MQDSLTLQPIAPVDGTVNLPGSKRVSNRALLLAALANGTTRLTKLLDRDDVRHMLTALQALGVQLDTVCRSHRVRSGGRKWGAESGGSHGSIPGQCRNGDASAGCRGVPRQ